MRGLTKASAPTGSVRRARGFLLVVCSGEHRACIPWWRVYRHIRTYARRHACCPIGLTRSRENCFALRTTARTSVIGKAWSCLAPLAPPLLLFGPRPKPDCGPTVHGTHKHPASSRNFASVVGAYGNPIGAENVTFQSDLICDTYIESVENNEFAIN